MSYSSEVLADSPLGYWRLGESSGTSAADASGNSRTGTYSGSPSLGATGALLGDTNTAVTFDGSNDYVEVPATGLDTGDFTVEAWFKTSTVSKRQIASRWDNTSQARQRWTLQVGSDGKLFFYCYDGSYHNVSSASSVANGSWRHAAVTVSGANITLYLDGSPVATGTKGAGFSGGSTPLRIGATYNGAEFFDGQIDEVSICGSALSSGRIAAHHYAAGIVGPITIAGDAAAATSSALNGTPLVGLRVAGDAATATATALDGTIPVTVPILVTGDAATATATALEGLGRLRVAGDPATATATGLGGYFPGAPIIVEGEAATATAAALDGFAFTPPPRNGFGLVLDSSAILAVDDVLEPEPTVPAGTPSTALHIVAPTVPVPTLVAGRPQ